MTRRLIVARRAEIQIAKAQRWWRAHRDAVDLLSQELDEAFSLIRQYPHIGKSVQTRHGKFMRRVTLDGTRYLLYYRVRDDAVEVAALWHGSRRPPRLWPRSSAAASGSIARFAASRRGCARTRLCRSGRRSAPSSSCASRRRTTSTSTPSAA